MDNKKMKDEALEQVSGGQAVLPLLSQEETIEMVSANFTRAQCPFCKAKFPVPLSQKGKKINCQECGAEFIL